MFFPTKLVLGICTKRQSPFTFAAHQTCLWLTVAENLQILTIFSVQIYEMFQRVRGADFGKAWFLIHFFSLICTEQETFSSYFSENTRHLYHETQHINIVLFLPTNCCSRRTKTKSINTRTFCRQNTGLIFSLQRRQHEIAPNIKRHHS